ncbi:MAG: hypothetical protein ACOY3I_00485 [Verrucomicrobiota bacterium]
MIALAAWASGCAERDPYVAVRTPKDLELLLAMEPKDVGIVRARLFKTGIRRIERGDIDGALEVGRMIRGDAGAEIFDRALNRLNSTRDQKKIVALALELADRNRESQDMINAVVRWCRVIEVLAKHGQKERANILMEETLTLAQKAFISQRRMVSKNLGVAMAKATEIQRIKEWSARLAWKEEDSPLVFSAKTLIEDGNVLGAVSLAESLEKTGQARAFYYLTRELIRQKRTEEAHKMLTRFWEAWDGSEDAKYSAFGVDAGSRCLLSLGEKDDAKKRILEALKNKFILDHYRLVNLADEFLRLNDQGSAREILMAGMEVLKHTGDYSHLCEASAMLGQTGDGTIAEKLLEELWSSIGEKVNQIEAWNLQKRVMVAMANGGHIDRAVALLDQVKDRKRDAVLEFRGLSSEASKNLFTKLGFLPAWPSGYHQVESNEISALQKMCESDDGAQMLAFIHKQPTEEKKNQMLAMLMHRLFEKRQLDQAVILADALKSDLKIQALLQAAQAEPDRGRALSMLTQAMSAWTSIEKTHTHALFEIASLLAQKEENIFSAQGQKLKSEILKQLSPKGNAAN